MNPARVDFVVDLAYGILIFVAIGLILVAGTAVGVAFGLGALVAYVIHIGWKMSKFDPDWMTREVTEKVTEEVSDEVEETVGDTVSEQMDDVAHQVEETMEAEMTTEIEETVSEQIEQTVGEEVDEMVDTLDEIEERTADESGS
jgi:hypothetical protein